MLGLVWASVLELVSVLVLGVGVGVGLGVGVGVGFGVGVGVGFGVGVGVALESVLVNRMARHTPRAVDAGKYTVPTSGTLIHIVIPILLQKSSNQLPIPAVVGCVLVGKQRSSDRLFRPRYCSRCRPGLGQRLCRQEQKRLAKLRQPIIED